MKWLVREECRCLSNAPHNPGTPPVAPWGGGGGCDEGGLSGPRRLGSDLWKLGGSGAMVLSVVERVWAVVVVEDWWSVFRCIAVLSLAAALCSVVRGVCVCVRVCVCVCVCVCRCCPQGSGACLRSSQPNAEVVQLLNITFLLHQHKDASCISCTAFVACHDTHLMRIFAFSAFTVPVCHVPFVCVCVCVSASVHPPPSPSPRPPVTPPTTLHNP